MQSQTTLGTLLGSLALPLVGRQIDRRGSLLMVVIIAALFGLACIFMGLVAVFTDLYGNLWDLLQLKDDHPLGQRQAAKGGSFLSGQIRRICLICVPLKLLR